MLVETNILSMFCRLIPIRMLPTFIILFSSLILVLTEVPFANAKIYNS